MQVSHWQETEHSSNEERERERERESIEKTRRIRLVWGIYSKDRSLLSRP